MTALSTSLFVILCWAVHFTYQVENGCPQNGQREEGNGHQSAYLSSYLRTYPVGVVVISAGGYHPDHEVYLLHLSDAFARRGDRNGTYPKCEQFISSFTYINITWRMVGNSIQYSVQSFTIFYKKATDEGSTWQSVPLPANYSNYVVKNLEPAKTYRFQLAASTGPDELSCSEFRKAKTLGWDKPCDCNLVGSNGTKCDIKNGQCPCKTKGTLGRTCNSCDKKWIWHDKLGCVKCQCPEDDRSKGTCFYDEDRIQHCDCFGNFGGPECRSCANGYYYTSTCVPCECNNNTDPSAKKICDPKRGECMACAFNTAGANCELCKEGYEGSGINRNCTTIGVVNPIHVENHRMSHSLTIVMGICASIGVVIVLMIGICVARRNCWRKPPMQLWTVELKDDHENVSFNSMLENPEYQNVNASLLMDDVQFYGHSTPVYQPVVEKNRIKGKGFDGGMSYHTLGDRNMET